MERSEGRIMTRRYWTIVVLLNATAFVLGWDLYIAIQRDWNATVSAVVYDAMKLHPMIPLAAGVIIGHFAWPIQRGAE